jgi:hypothetical protein
VPGVPCGFLQHVTDDPAQVALRLLARPSAHLIEVYMLHDGRDTGPHLAVVLHGRLDRVAGLDFLVGQLHVLSGESDEKPRRLGARQMLGEPQQARPADHRRLRRSDVVYADDLAYEGLAVILQQRDR